MKFLEAKGGNRGVQNKMLPGSRPDQNGAGSQPGTPTVRPEVQALADELGINLSTVSGTGKEGSITKFDVKRAAAERDAAGSNDPSGN